MGSFFPLLLVVALIHQVHGTLGALVLASAESLCHFKHTNSHQSSWVWSPAKSQQLLPESMHVIPKISGNTWAGVKGIYSLKGNTV